MNIPDDKIDELVGQIAQAVSESKHTIVYALRLSKGLDDTSIEMAYEAVLRKIVRYMLDKYSQK